MSELEKLIEDANTLDAGKSDDRITCMERDLRVTSVEQNIGKLARTEVPKLLARIAELEAEVERLNDGAKWHRDKAKEARSRENYFRHGRGFITHCQGAMGAERAAEDYRKRAEFHEMSADALQEQNDDAG